jgi:hypothetical protein
MPNAQSPCRLSGSYRDVASPWKHALMTIGSTDAIRQHRVPPNREIGFINGLISRSAVFREGRRLVMKFLVARRFSAPAFLRALRYLRVSKSSVLHGQNAMQRQF